MTSTYSEYLSYILPLPPLLLLTEHVPRSTPSCAVFIDLNGSREMETLLPMIDAYEAVLRPALIVVKSNKLKHLISKCSNMNQLSAEHTATSQRDVHGYRQYRR